MSDQTQRQAEQVEKADNKEKTETPAERKEHKVEEAGGS